MSSRSYTLEALQRLGGGRELRTPAWAPYQVDEVQQSMPFGGDASTFNARRGQTMTGYLLGAKNQLMGLLEREDEEDGEDSAAAASLGDDERAASRRGVSFGDRDGVVHGLASLLTSITAAIKTVGAAVRRMSLPKSAMSSPAVLNRLANEAWINSLRFSGQCSVMVSEEIPEPIIIDEPIIGHYVVAFDPLTGLAEPPCQDMGAIFGIFRPLSSDRAPSVADFLQPGRQMVAAGYALYGACTKLMFSIGDGVHGFTLDTALNEFFLTNDNVRIPYSGAYYAVNEGYSSMYDARARAMLLALKEHRTLDGERRKLRYVGSMVADVHRTIVYGGVYLYLAHTERPEGRFKLLYEAAPLAFLVEQAGGQASSGTQALLDITPRSVHHRTPVVLGSEDDVNFVCSFLAAGGGEATPPLAPPPEGAAAGGGVDDEEVDEDDEEDDDDDDIAEDDD